MRRKKALLVVDMQNDFCPGGALGIPQGDKIISKINRYVKFFAKKKLSVFASRDWHPVRTAHFKDFGGLWPVHCIANTRGASFHLSLKLNKDAIMLYKGTDPQKDSYSVFQAHDEKGISFAALLKLLNVNELYIGGLATDYCVKSTVLDALKNKFKVKILLDAMKGVDLQKGDSEKSIKEMIKKGAKKATSKQIIK